MLNVMIVGGSSLEEVRRVVGTDKINIEYHYKYIDDAFKEIIGNGEKYLDIDVTVVLQYGFRHGEPQMKQITNLQEVMSVSRLNSKLYFLLRDKEEYDKCAENENIIVYDNTRILYINKLFNKTVIDIIEGRMDSRGIAKEEEEEEELYDEDIGNKDVGESKFDIENEDKDDSYGIVKPEKIKGNYKKDLRKKDNVKEDDECEDKEEYVGEGEKIKGVSKRHDVGNKEEEEEEDKRNEVKDIKKEKKVGKEKQEKERKGIIKRKHKEVEHGDVVEEREKKGILGKGLGIGLGKGILKGKNKEEKIKQKPTKEESLIERVSSVREVEKRTRRGVIAVTGDRKSGVTSVARHMAEVYALQGNSVLLLDLDLKLRTMGTTYGEFNRAEEDFTNTQLGVLTVLNNPDMIEYVNVIVKDNLALIGMSRDNEYRVERFADKDMEEVVNTENIISLIGVAKGLFDVIVIDFPLEEMRKYMGVSLIIDEVVLCVENNLNSLDVLFNIIISDLLDEDGVHTKSILDKSKVVLTRYSVNSKIDGRELDEEYVQHMLRGNVHNRMEVIGRMSNTEVFYNQIEKNKSLIDLRAETRQEFINIVDNLK